MKNIYTHVDEVPILVSFPCLQKCKVSRYNFLHDVVAETDLYITYNYTEHMSRVARKPVFGVSSQVRHKAGCTTTEGGYRNLKFLINEVEGLYYLYDVAKTKADLL